MSDVKAAVAAMMRLPKAERMERLLAMSAECVARQEDAAPFLSLIQLELDTADNEQEQELSRPASTASASAAVRPAPPPNSNKSTRRLLKEKRDELRAMLAKVDNALGSSSSECSASVSRQSSRSGGSGRPDAIAFAHMSRGEKLQLARQAGFKASGGGGAGAGGGSAAAARRPPLVEVPAHIKERFRDEYEADPEAFRRTWSEQTPEFRQLCSLPGKAPTPSPTPPATAASSAHGGSTSKLTEAQVEALLRKAQGGKAQVGDARAAGSNFAF